VAPSTSASWSSSPMISASLTSMSRHCIGGDPSHGGVSHLEGFPWVCQAGLLCINPPSLRPLLRHWWCGFSWIGVGCLDGSGHHWTCSWRYYLMSPKNNMISLHKHILIVSLHALSSSYYVQNVWLQVLIQFHDRFAQLVFLVVFYHLFMSWMCV
jgi:hypothetical protein